MKLDRMLAIIMYLSNHEKVKAHELAEHMVMALPLFPERNLVNGLMECLRTDGSYQRICSMAGGMGVFGICMDFEPNYEAILSNEGSDGIGRLYRGLQAGLWVAGKMR